MLIDNNLVLGLAQAVTASGATTSYIDQQAAADAVEDGIWAIFLISTAFVGNSATIAFAIQTATDSAFTSPITLTSTGAITDTTLVLGYVPLKARLGLGALRYIRGYYTVTGTASTGKIDCRLVEDVDNFGI